MPHIDWNWRLNPEVKREAWEYAHTGRIVDDTVWHSLEQRRELDPARFDHNHPNIAGYFVAPAVLGMQPHGPVLDAMRQRFLEHPDIFRRHHEFWGKIFGLEPTILHVPVPPVIPPSVPRVGTPSPPIGQASIPEPDSLVLLGVALVIVLVAMWRRR